MGKLINRQFKEDFKLIVLWLLIPLIAAIIFTRLAMTFEDSALVMLGTMISFMALTIGPAVAAVLVAKNDYERFYGKYAAFYSALPVSSRSITIARMIHYLIMTIIITFIVMLDFLIIIYASGVSTMDYGYVFRELSMLINNFGAGFIISSIFFIISALILSVMMIIFSVTAGSTKISGRSIKFGPIIVYILLSIVIGMTFSFVQYNVLEIFSPARTIIESNSANVIIEATRNVSPMIVLIPAVFSVILSGLMYYGTYFFHDKKLSVA